MKKYYTGIGSRATPDYIQEWMFDLAAYLSEQGYTLRSGGAQGADSAFESGCDEVLGEKEIYLPWASFEGSGSNLVVSSKEAFEIAEKYHPNWSMLSQGAQRLQARNVHQILGKDLKNPTKFIVCYTKKGARKGGTGQALRIAEDYNIPIFDCGKYETMGELEHSFSEFMNEVEN